MSRERATRFLSQRQRLAWADHGVFAPPPIRSMPLERLDPKLLAQLNSGDPSAVDLWSSLLDQREAYVAALQLPTAWEVPWPYAIAMDSLNRIDIARSKAGISPVPHPVLGTMPFGDIQAQTIRVPGCSEFVIILDSNFPEFARRMSVAVANLLVAAGGDQGDIPTNLDLATLYKQRAPVIDAVADLAWYATGNTDDPGEMLGPTSMRALKLQTVLMESCMAFALGHELGHLEVGHLDADNTRGEPPGAALPSAVNYTDEQEYEADRAGLICSMAVARHVLNTGPEALLAGPAFYFGAMNLLDKLRGVLLGPSRDRIFRSHTSPADRRAALGNWTGIQNKVATEAAMVGASNIDTVFDFIWAEAGAGSAVLSWFLSEGEVDSEDERLQRTIAAFGEFMEHHNAHQRTIRRQQAKRAVIGAAQIGVAIARWHLNRRRR